MTIPARRVDNLRAMLQITRDCVDVEAANGVRVHFGYTTPRCDVLLAARCSAEQVAVRVWALSLPVQKGSQLAQPVLCHRADASLLNSQVTPLMLAGTWGSLEATQCLVEAGADLFARASLQHRGPSDKVASLSDCQVLHFVSCAGFKRELQTQALLETAQALADAGADPLACTAEGLLPVDLVMDRMGPLGVLMVELTEAAARRKQREMQLSSRASDTSSGQGQLRPTSRGAVGPEAVGLDRLGSLRPMPRRAESSQLLEAGGAGGRSDARVQSHGAASPAGRSRRMSAVLPMSPPGGSTFKSLKGSELSGPGYASYRAGASAGYGHAGAQGTGGSSQSGGDTRDSSDGGSRGTNRYGWAGRGEHAGAGNSSRETSGRSLAPLSPPQGGRRGSAEYASLEGRLTPPLQRSLRRPAASLDGRRMREAAQSLTTARNGDGAAADAGRRLDWAQTGNRGGTAPSPFVRASEGQGAKGGPSPGGYADGGAGVMPWGLQPQGRRPRPEDSTSLDGSAASQRSRATTPVGGVLASSGGSSESLSGPTRVTRRE